MTNVYWNRVTFGNDIFKAVYDEEHNQFFFYSELDGDWECFGAQIIKVESQKVIVYTIGIRNWLWEETLQE